MNRYVIYVEKKDLKIISPAISLTNNTFVGINSNHKNFESLVKELKEKFSKKAMQLPRGEVYHICVGDITNGHEMNFHALYDGSIQFSYSLNEPFSSYFINYMKENYPKILTNPKTNIQRIDDNEDEWPLWKVVYIGESGRKYFVKISAKDEMHARDIAWDYFWDIADDDDDKLSKIINITKM